MKLFIDSATNYLYLAVIDGDKAYSFSREGRNDHSETLTNYLETFLDKHSIKVEDIKEVYVGRGPGSYTGLRIAGTVGKVYAFIKELPLYSFSSLDLIFAKVADNDGLYKAMIKAKKNHSYLKAYKVENGKITVQQEDMFLCDDELVKFDEYEKINVDEDFFNDDGKLALNIIKYNLYKEENTFTYVPNYLRSELS